MIQHFCLMLCDSYVRLMQGIDDLKQTKDFRGELDKNEKRRVATIIVEPLISELQKLKLETTETLAYHVTSLHQRLIVNERFTTEQLLEAFKHIQADLILLLKDLKFAYLPPDNAMYFEKDKLFGEKVYDSFPSVREELRAAGNCLSADLGTAAVFHLMRVAERGMKTLLWDRDVTVVDNKPLELQDWRTMIKGLEEAIEKINNWPNTLGLAKTQAEEFYNNAKQEFQGFKDAWRNHVMHDRRTYTFDDAKSISGHVSRFMQMLAKRISESQQTPLIWTEKEVQK